MCVAVMLADDLILFAIFSPSLFYFSNKRPESIQSHLNGNIWVFFRVVPDDILGHIICDNKKIWHRRRSRSSSSSRSSWWAPETTGSESNSSLFTFQKRWHWFLSLFWLLLLLVLLLARDWISNWRNDIHFWKANHRREMRVNGVGRSAIRSMSVGSAIGKCWVGSLLIELKKMPQVWLNYMTIGEWIRERKKCQR